MVLKLTEERKGQIALVILKKDVKSKQVYLNRQDLRRRISSGAEQLKNNGISKEELESFYEEIVREAVEEMFANEKE